MYIARFTEGSFRVQTVSSHILNVANLCRIYGQKINIPDFAYLAGLLHDMGKYNIEFQNYIRLEMEKSKIDHINDKASNADKVDHGVFGAKYIYEKFHERDQTSSIVSEILAVVCCYHHGGLPDCINSNNEIPLLERINKLESSKMKETYDCFYNDLNIDIEGLFNSACVEFENIANIIMQFESQAYFSLHLFIKTVYSILIDADRYDSYLFEVEKEISFDELNDDTNPELWIKYLAELEKKLDKYKNITTFNENEKRVNRVRQDISDECLEFADNNEGIYTLTVPTGGGKTLASLRYALKHASLKNKDRIIYVVPYTTIIEQNADEVRNTLKCGSSLLEHHSNVLEDDKGENYKLLTHRWSNRIIFTTMVQFLNTFYNKGTQDMRRIHNLLNSIIIFDEIQTIPIKCIELFNSCIKYLNIVGNSTVVLCSATQPELSISNISLKSNEIIKDVNNKFEALQRVEVIDKTKRERYSFEEAADFIYEAKQKAYSVLFVCNTINSAEVIYDILAGKINDNTQIFFLSSNLCPAHRKEIIKNLKDCLVKRKHIICVSTQLIEAGVDISFNTTIRALSGLDSIAQTAGRGNRNGEMDNGYCYIINLNDENVSRLTEIRIGKAHCEELLYKYKQNKDLYNNSLLSPESIRAYFECYYSDKDIKNNMDYPIKNRTVYEMLDYSDLNISGYEGDYPLNLRYLFKKASESFKVIDNDTYTVVVPYKEGNDLISEFLSNTSLSEKKELINKLGQYSVNIYRNKYNTIIEEGGITLSKEYNVHILCNAFYDQIKGLTTNKKLELLSF